jgi:hypothetical protein
MDASLSSDAVLVEIDQLSSRWDSRSHEATCVIRRNANLRRTIGDHHGRMTGRANLLVRGVDGFSARTANRRRYRPERS